MYKFVSIDYWRTLVKTHSDNKEVMWEALKPELGMTREDYDHVEKFIKTGLNNTPDIFAHVSGLRYWVYFKNLASGFNLDFNKDVSVNRLSYVAKKALRDYKYIYAPGAVEVIRKLKNDDIPFIIASNCGKFSATSHMLNYKSYNLNDLHLALITSLRTTTINFGVPPVVTSSSIGAAKPNLLFFEEVVNIGKRITNVNKLNLEKDWLHIGDDLVCDINPVLTMGGDTLHVNDFETDWLTRIPEKIWNT